MYDAHLNMSALFCFRALGLSDLGPVTSEFQESYRDIIGA